MKRLKYATFTKKSKYEYTNAKIFYIVIIPVNTEVLHMTHVKYSVPKEIPLVFHNRSNYDYHFIKRNKKRVLRGKFNWLTENTEKHKTFSVPITKRAKRIGRNREETTKT